MIECMGVVCILLKTALNTKDIGKMTCNMVKERSVLQTVPTQAHSMKVKNMGMERILGWMVMYMKESGKIIKYTAKELLSGQTVESMKDNGKMVKWMELELLRGQTVESMKESIKMIQNMVRELLHGKTVASM